MHATSLCRLWRLLCTWHVCLAQGLKRERQTAAAGERGASADGRSEALVPDGRAKPRKKSKLAAAVAAAVE